MKTQSWHHRHVFPHKSQVRLNDFDSQLQFKYFWTWHVVTVVAGPVGKRGRLRQ
jgi:hypothetical protein